MPRTTLAQAWPAPCQTIPAVLLRAITVLALAAVKVREPWPDSAATGAVTLRGMPMPSGGGRKRMTRPGSSRPS